MFSCVSVNTLRHPAPEPTWSGGTANAFLAFCSRWHRSKAQIPLPPGGRERFPGFMFAVAPFRGSNSASAGGPRTLSRLFVRGGNLPRLWAVAGSCCGASALTAFAPALPQHLSSRQLRGQCSAGGRAFLTSFERLQTSSCICTWHAPLLRNSSAAGPSFERHGWRYAPSADCQPLAEARSR